MKAKNVSGDTALVHAINKKNIKCFKPLLKAGPDLNAEMDETSEGLNDDYNYPHRDPDDYEFSDENEDSNSRY